MMVAIPFAHWPNVNPKQTPATCYELHLHTKHNLKSLLITNRQKLFHCDLFENNYMQVIVAYKTTSAWWMPSNARWVSARVCTSGGVETRTL